MLIAVLHVFLVETSSQTRWKGGGFGMYSDPHPNSYRVVWLVGEDENGEAKAFALDPLDDRVRLRRIEQRSKRKALRRLEQVAEDGKNFPSLIDVEAVAAPLRALRHGDSGDEALERVLAILPQRDLRLRVMEIRITEDYSALETREIDEVPIP